ncbi:Plasmid segregation protein parM (Protein stbA) (ParA locus 36 kDa protein) [Escherichia coli]|uniref:Plasmid segregation protein parM (Protein stbA) (ParA locus 36 kDa protein) n=1 Tax=Escherichia coli TaxID=562 RepID=A0A2X3KA01_ECOLX|nr:Plasmid segregation protein parM (Protein stbA) (ParA locus 36 kDa protein) [Escherichia coli]
MKICIRTTGFHQHQAGMDWRTANAATPSARTASSRNGLRRSVAPHPANYMLDGVRYGFDPVSDRLSRRLTRNTSTAM